MKHLLLVTLSIFFLSTSNANADTSCNAMIDDLTAYASKTTDYIFHPGHYNVVRVRMATSRPDNRYVSYADGLLKRNEIFLRVPGRPPVLISTTLLGNSQQSFSDRSDYITYPCNPGELCSGYNQLFSGKKVDSLDISIGRDGNVQLTLKTWGSNKVSIAGTCFNSVLHGTSADGSHYLFSFSKETLPGAPA